jgi:phosphoglycolate phosphatase-like HAD superfamily hydrolase
MVRGVIFDIDGTLLDSVDLHARAWQETFRHFGHQIPFAEIRQQIGKGADKLIPHFLSPDESRNLGDDLNKYRAELWKRDYLPRVKPFPRVRELFQRILEDGKKIALASSAKGDELKTYKKIAGIEDLVHEETSSDDVERSKPDPDIIHAAIAKLQGFSPEELIMVGDTPWDALAANKAEVPTIGVLCGGVPEEQLREAGCLAIYRDPADLLTRYEDSPLKASESKAA